MKFYRFSACCRNAGQDLWLHSKTCFDRLRIVSIPAAGATGIEMID